MTQRRVLIHYHIFKNAGCSVDACLKASFGDGWKEFEGSHAHDIQSSEQLARFLRANERVVAVSSHLARLPLPWNGCLPIVFLRHPLLRARSVYEFTRQDPTQPFADVVRGMGFADYVRWALRKERGSIVIRNYQVVHLSQASWRCANILDAEAGQADFEEARDSITKWGVVGIVESFALSARVFNARYGPIFPKLNLRNVHVNTTSSNSTSVVDKIEQCRDLLGSTLHDAFMAANALDADLYEHARNVLDRAVRATLQPANTF